MNELDKLTKRELFAAMAMQGLCADPNMDTTYGIASKAIRIADVLIEELERTKPKDQEAP